MLKLFSKLGTASGLLTGVFVINFDKVVDSTLVASGNRKQEETQKTVTNIANLEEIILFEKENKCSFTFIGSWDKKEAWTVREFLKKENNNNKWNDKVVKGANDFKENCKSKGSVALFYGGDSGNQRFGLDENKFKT